MVKVSVIMPVYNGEDYLAESIECILNQTLDDLELICVDDGSVDSSLDILNDFAAKDKRVRVYHQENRGGGAARNVAITHAVGEYLYCMDADDMVELTALEELYDIATKKDVDFIIFQALNYDDELDEYYHNDYYDMNEIADFVGDKIFNHEDLGNKIFKISVTPWCKFYNLEFVKRSGAQFAEGLIFHDNIFFWDILFEAERIYFYRKFLYTRRRHIKSSTGAGDKRYVSTITINNMIVQKFINHGQFEKYKKRLYGKKLSLVYRRFGEVQDQFKPFFYSEMKKDFNKMLSHERYDDFMENVQKRNRQRFEDVVNSKDFDDFMRLYENHELNDNQKSEGNFASKVSSSIKKLFK